MTPEDRRAMLVATTLPLIAEYGTAVTTAQIARAAGIGEATIFRVFADKDELLDACVVEALRPDHAVTQIASISLDQPVSERLLEAADALAAHLGRIGAVTSALRTSGHRHAERGDRGAVDPRARETSMDMVRDAIADLLEPENLRMPAVKVAEVFLNLLSVRPMPGRAVTTAESIDVFLNGALK